MSFNKTIPITKAVFPVAGLGTRFLPATKASPKEMLNVVDKPLIQYAVEEAIESGITQLIFITGRNKRSIEDHFDKAYELEAELDVKNKQELLTIVRNIKPSHVDCVYIRQSEALGLGHAVMCAEKLVGNEAFAVILADDLLQGSPPVLSQMIEAYYKYRVSILAVEKIMPEKSSAYGVIAGINQGNHFYSLSGIIEKPQPKDAPSDLGVVGRYILSPEIFSHIRNLKIGTGGEYQLTDAIESLLHNQNIMAYEFDGIRYDCGDKLGFLRATIQTALKHPELCIDFKKYLMELKQTQFE
jgi:UTP--glucose-1-phosphate uridylyltransferase